MEVMLYNSFDLSFYFLQVTMAKQIQVGKMVCCTSSVGEFELGCFDPRDDLAMAFQKLRLQRLDLQHNTLIIHTLGCGACIFWIICIILELSYSICKILD